MAAQAQSRKVQIVLLELLFVLGMAVFTVLLFKFDVKLLLKPGGHDTILDIVMFQLVFWIQMAMGVFAGLVIWIWSMRPFLSRQEIEDCLTKPNVPYLSSLMRKVFFLIYRN